VAIGLDNFLDKKIFHFVEEEVDGQSRCLPSVSSVLMVRCKDMLPKRKNSEYG
jgi:hypothetical protein